jgi:hypothetical protein
VHVVSQADQRFPEATTGGFPGRERRPSRRSFSEDSYRAKEVDVISDTAAVPAPVTRDEAGTLLGQTMGLVAVTAGLFALGAYLGRNLSYGWGWALWIASFAALIGVNLAASRSEGVAITLLFGFGLLVGLATAPTLSYYASTDP